MTKRSYSQDFIQRALLDDEKKPEVLLQLNGKLSKKISDQRSAKWHGCALQFEEPKRTVKKSPMRWDEYESSKRTLIPEYAPEPKAFRPRAASSVNCSSISDMINQADSNDRRGRISKKVILNGKQVTKNATSVDNKTISAGMSSAYKDLHSGQWPSFARPQKMMTDLSRAKKTSQISTLPGGPVYQDELKSRSSWSENKIIETANPCIKKRSDLTLEKEKLITSFTSFCDQNPLSFETTPLNKGKMRDQQAFERMYKGEVSLQSTIRKKSVQSRDLFKSSLILS